MASLSTSMEPFSSIAFGYRKNYEYLTASYRKIKTDTENLTAETDKKVYHAIADRIMLVVKESTYMSKCMLANLQRVLPYHANESYLKEALNSLDALEVNALALAALLYIGRKDTSIELETHIVKGKNALQKFANSININNRWNPTISSSETSSENEILVSYDSMDFKESI